MRMKFQTLIKLWVIITLILTAICVFAVYSINAADIKDVAECQVEVGMVGLPSVTVIEKEKEVIIEKEELVYEFPFETKDLGTYAVKGSCEKCLPQKEYSKMRAKSKVTVFASENVLPEGTLVWIENVGIRQVQTVYSEYNGIFVYFDSHNDEENFGEQELRVFEILE